MLALVLESSADAGAAALVAIVAITILLILCTGRKR